MFSTLFNKVEKFVLDSVNGDEELANKIILKACTNYSLKIEQIKGNKCLNQNCKKRPYFNYEGETKGLFCYEHKSEGMIDVIHERCSFNGCSKRPVFNYEGKTKGLFCYEHKSEGMIDVKT